MQEKYAAVRGRLLGVFGTRAGAWMIKHVFRPLDYLYYRVSGGRALFIGAVVPTLMLTTTGAKSGQPRTVPLIFMRDGRRIVLLASNYGGASHPAWYHNLRANPGCSVTLGGRVVAYTAREAAGAERAELWRRAVSFYAGYSAYQTRAEGRQIPIMILDPAE